MNAATFVVVCLTVPGIIGCYQALEAIKICANFGSILRDICMITTGVCLLCHCTCLNDCCLKYV